MKIIKRNTRLLTDMIRATKENLKQFNVSETVIEYVIKAYIEAKREALLQGDYIKEDGIATEGILVRGVSKGFTDEGFTVKVKESVDWGFRAEAMERVKSDKDLQDRLEINNDIKERLNKED